MKTKIASVTNDAAFNEISGKVIQVYVDKGLEPEDAIKHLTCLLLELLLHNGVYEIEGGNSQGKYMHLKIIDVSEDLGTLNS